MTKFGDLVTEQRLSLGLTLREFCIKNNMNSDILSKIERNIQLPRKCDMSEFIEALKIFEGSPEHRDLIKAYDEFEPEVHEFSGKDLPVFFNPDVDPEKLIKFLKETDLPDNTRDLFK